MRVPDFGLARVPENLEKSISPELLVRLSWLTPHFNQKVHISIVNFNIESMRNHLYAQKCIFL